MQLNPGQSLVSHFVGEQTSLGLVSYTPGRMGTRTPDTFAVGGSDPNYVIEIYYPAQSGESKTFVFSYVVANAVVAYRNVADLQWTWIGENNDVFVERLLAKVRIPVGIENAEEFRVWGHGSLSGKVTKVSNSEAEWVASGVKLRLLSTAER